jgi:CHAT domain-containing protein
VKSSEAKTLLAAVTRTCEGPWQSLLHAGEELELIQTVVPPQVILRHDGDINNSDIARPFTNTRAQTVLEHIPKATIIHLACHGYQNTSNPLESGFIMADERLTISKLMSLSLPNALFAFLSACETARGDDKQPDQAVHLAAAMIFVGFKSVIGTMW